MPGTPARSMSTSTTSVPARLFTAMWSAPPRALNWMRSTSFRSMAILATSRKKVARPPLAEMSMFSLALEPLKSRVSKPAWPSTTSLPSPGAQVNTSSPAPMKVVSLPWLPSMTSLPSPPSSRSAPWPPTIVSLPAPPSIARWADVADSALASILSSPPLALMTMASVVPTSMVNGAGSMRSTRTRAPLVARANSSAPLPPLTSRVSTPEPPSARSLSSPGFQIMRSSPASPNIWSSPSPPVNVSLPSPPNRRSAPPRPRRTSLPLWPKIWSAPEPPKAVSLPAPPNSRARGSAPLVSSRERVSLPPNPNIWMSPVFATVGWPPATGTAPPFTRIVPAASRLAVTELSLLSPNTLSTPAFARKEAVIAMMFRSSSRVGYRGRMKAGSWRLPNLRPQIVDGSCDPISQTVLVTSDARGFSALLNESTAQLPAHMCTRAKTRLVRELFLVIGVTVVTSRADRGVRLADSAAPFVSVFLAGGIPRVPARNSGSRMRVDALLGVGSCRVRSVAVLVQGRADLRLAQVAGGHHERIDSHPFGHATARLDLHQQLDRAIAHLERILHDERVQISAAQIFLEDRAIVEAHEPRPPLRRQRGEGAQRAEGGEVRGREDGVEAAGIGRQRRGDRGLGLADAMAEIDVDDDIETHLPRRIDEPSLARRRRDDVRSQAEDPDFGPL